MATLATSYALSSYLVRELIPLFSSAKLSRDGIKQQGGISPALFLIIRFYCIGSIGCAGSAAGSATGAAGSGAGSAYGSSSGAGAGSA